MSQEFGGARGSMNNRLIGQASPDRSGPGMGMSMGPSMGMKPSMGSAMGPGMGPGAGLKNGPRKPGMDAGGPQMMQRRD